MTIQDIEQFIAENPGEMLPLGGGSCIDPQCAIELLRGEPTEILDIFKRPHYGNA